MPRGFYVSNRLALTALDLIYNNIIGHGFRFHASLRDTSQSPHTSPATYAGVAGQVRQALIQHRDMELAIVADDAGIVTMVVPLHRALYQSGSSKRVTYAYDETMFQDAGWSRWALYKSADWQYTERVLRDGLRNCGETINDLDTLTLCISRGCMPSEIQYMAGVNPLLGAAAPAPDAAAAARAAERARRGL